MSLVEIELRKYLIPSECEALDLALADVPNENRVARIASLLSRAVRDDHRVASVIRGKV